MYVLGCTLGTTCMSHENPQAHWMKSSKTKEEIGKTPSCTYMYIINRHVHWHTATNTEKAVPDNYSLEDLESL